MLATASSAAGEDAPVADYQPYGTGRAVVIALHGCGQSASDYYGHSGWPKYADLYRVALVLPEQTSSNNPLSCFNWYTAGDIGRGQGEALSIKQMVDYAVAHYGSDPRRVYVTGLSAGGAMTAVQDQVVAAPPAADGPVLVELPTLAPGERSRSRYRLPRGLERLLGVVIFFALWELASQVGWLSPKVLAGPSTLGAG